MELTKRVRAKYTTSTKGIVTAECVVEYSDGQGGTGLMTNEEIADEVSALHNYMQAKYPVEA